MEKARQYSAVSWALFIFGLIALPVFAYQLIKGVQSGVMKGSNSDVDRAENPLVFKMAIVLNALFVLLAFWFLLEGFGRLIR